VFLVSHDRRFLDNVVTSTIVWEGDESPGRWREYEGGYEDWVVQRDRARALREQAARAAGKAREAPAAKPAAAAAPVSPTKPRKLSYKEQRELDELPRRIEALEGEQKALGEFLARPESYTKEADKAMQAQVRVAAIDDELLAAMERWEQLGAR
ncbi:MAG TPA: ABC transporter ATP-binding protein, partial [Burkholderiaceae bacterium]|nr:ABC transporter ATP-binding protein [Burkholderiaceae bacterium]